MTWLTLHFGEALLAWSALGAVVFLVLFFVPAPYGRYVREGFGPKVPARLGWFFMEGPSALVIALSFLYGAREARPGPVGWVFFALWEVHYVYRALVYPWLLSGEPKPMSLVVILSAVFFNLVNAGLNGLWLFVIRPVSGLGWLADPRFAVGAALFVVGFVTHVRADAVLRGLRRPGDSGYQIPRGGLYEWISCPNYFGEMVEWLGFALATWSLAALSFAGWTVANLLPRAIAHHRWYRAHFESYPEKRRALVPFVL